MKKISTFLLSFLCMAGMNSAIAQTVVFSEDFTDVKGLSSGNLVVGTGGNDGGWSNTVAANRLDAATWEAAGWAFSYNTSTPPTIVAFAGKDCIKLGTGSVQGIITTPALATLSGNAILTFRAGAWNSGSEKTTLLLEISGGGNLSDLSVLMQKGLFTAYTVYITGGTATTKITFKGEAASNSRFFLDDIKVVTGEAPITSNDATLSEIKINGTALAGFNATTLNYFVTMPVEHYTSIPTVTATATHANAQAVVTNLTAIPGYAYIDVTAENQVAKNRYSIHFSQEAAEGQKGSKTNPYTVAEAQAGQLPTGVTTKYWVRGFIVGTIGTGSPFILQTSGFVNSNLALAATSGEINTDNIIPVALPSGDARTALNLVDNAGNLGKEVLVYGTLETYFSVAGVRGVTDYQIVGSSAISATPADQKTIIASTGELLVKAAAGETITVYNVLGKAIAKTTAVAGETVIPVKGGQIVLVKAGNRVTKVIAR